MRFVPRIVLAVGLLSAGQSALAQLDVPSLVINEIHYDEADKTVTAEFIEIYNPTEAAIGLEGWEISGGVDFLFPPAASIESGAYLIIAQDPATIASKFRRSGALGPWSGRLRNSGETVNLRDPDGAVVSQVDYRLGFPWPTVGDPVAGESPSIQLIHPALETDLGGSWRSGQPTPGVRNVVYSTEAPPQTRQVSHSPQQPGYNEPVVITALVTDPDGVASVSLSYQPVRAGAYFGRYLEYNQNGTENLDPAYDRGWVDLPMSDDGQGDDEVAGDGVYTVTVPFNVNRNRYLIRYRITVEDAGGTSVRVPYEDDPQFNFAYFVYGGTPDWRGEIREGDTPVTYSGELMSSIPTYFLLSKSSWVDESQFGGYRGSEYLWPGTLVYEGKVYDHIRYRPRGGVHRFQFGKNFWKFDFNRGHRFQARDEYGNEYETKWSKLNFSSIVQQVNFQHRGEQGLFEGVGFRLFELCGVEASKTHHVQFYVIDQARPARSQYGTDYYGLFLAIEQMDGQFLDEHGLPDGNLYKIEGHSGESNNQGPTQVKNRSDVSAFISGYRSRNPSAQWWRDNLNVEKYLSYRTVVEAIHHYDIAYGKNYFYYHNPETGKFEVLPWDLDLTFANNMYGNGNHDFKSKVAQNPAFNTDYQNRVREILDLLFNRDEGYKLVDETMKFVYTPGEPSLVDVDRRMWDNHPRLNHKDRYYDISSTRDFAGMVRLVKAWITSRGSWMTRTLLSQEDDIPGTPLLNYSGPAGYPSDGLTFSCSAFTSPSRARFAGIEWRLAEVHNPAVANYDPAQPNIYEIEGGFESGVLEAHVPAYQFPPIAVRVGRTYRARVRMKDTAGRWSHWSQPVEFQATAPNISDHLRDLRISEFMYHPPEPVGDERLISTNRDEFEYVELKNVGPTTLDLRNVRFTKGIDFDFGGSGVEELNPGDYVLVVKNRVAFETRYGTELPVAGEYPNDNLRNSGERLKLSFGAGTTIHDIDEYSDDLPWPTASDGEFSLVLRGVDEFLSPDHNDPSNWRISRFPGGTPGGDDSLDYAAWKEGYEVSEDFGDGDNDGMVTMLEFFLGGDPNVASEELLPKAGAGTFMMEDGEELFLTLTFTREVAADELNYVVEFSSDLVTWTGEGVLVSQLPSENNDGLVTETWRAGAPVPDGGRLFARLRVWD
ncbi:MAG: CotH kinase family protein [Roseibacillus sp.]|nr:CotH kinase family protein [Roseibacillus sp.]